MSHKKNILVVGLDKNQEENKEQPREQPVEKKRHHHLFSHAVFSESFKSKRGSLFLVSFLNALIMVIILVIRSNLNINATSDARKDRFSNANREKTIKQGTIGLYNEFSSSADAIVTFDKGEATRRSSISSARDKVDDDTLKSGLDSAKTIFRLTYTLTSGDEAKKNAAAKAAARKVIESSVDSSSSYTEEEKKAAKRIASSFFDCYIQDKNASTRDLLIQCLPSTISSIRCEQAKKDEKVEENVTKILSECFDKVFNQNLDKDQAIQEAIYPLRKARASEDQLEFIVTASEQLDGEYQKDKQSYLADSSIHDKVLTSAVKNYRLGSFENRLYYDCLPDFTVNYATSDFGYPITYVETGEIGENGNKIRKAVEVKTYNPSVFIPVKGDRGTTSTRVEKRHKKAITGEDYTEEEYAKAKEDAKDNRAILASGLDNFLVAFNTRDENNTNRFFDGKNVIDSAISDAAKERIRARGKQQIIDNYNDKHDIKVSSLDEITTQNSSRDGKTRRNTLASYASSSITSFKTYYGIALNEGYSSRESTRIATVKASQGVINQLPDKVGGSLSDMGKRNVYGIIIGRIGFARTTLLVPMVYSILLANDLVANKVETGSLAFTLSTPLTRDSYIFTEACFRIFSEFVMGLTLFVFTTISRYIGISLGGTDLLVSLPREHVACCSLGNFRVILAISGICFLSSCIFNKSNKAIGIGGGLTIFFFICSILGLFGTRAIPGTIRIDSRNIFNYRTIISFFDPLAVRDGDYVKFFLKLVGLLVITVVTYISSEIIFKKKDLPL